MFSCKALLRMMFVPLFLAALSISPPPVRAMTVAEVTFADSVQAGSVTLPLYNAALLRYLKFIKVYVAALYLPAGVTADRVLTDVPKRLVLHYLVSFDRDDFIEGAESVLQRNQTPAELAAIRSRIERLNAAYLAVKPGDRYALTYLPGKGTELALNGTPLVVIEGADFAAAYFGIWLGRDSLDDTLKEDLLGKR